MKSYPAYPEYSPDGFPASWEQKRLRFALRMNPSKNEIDLDDSDMVSFVPMDAVGEYGGIRLSEEKELSEIGSGYTYFYDDDVVVAKITPCFENGKGSLAKGLKNKTAFGTTELHVMRADREQLEPEFLFYLTISDLFRKIGESEMYGAGGQKRVPESFIKDFRVGLPSVCEQQAIARFLDFKTAQIDALIAKKKALLDKLAEKRTALISHAVTKGLDPTVAIKDSEVAWLGHIPAHWEAKRTKFAVSYIGSGKTPKGGSEVYVQEGTMILRSQNVHDKGLRLDDVAYITDEADSAQAASRVLAGDVLLNITGASIGRTSIVPTPFPKANVNQHVCILRPVQDLVNPEYLHLLLCSRQAKDQISSLENGTSREGLNFTQVGGLLFAFPPIQEQVAIVLALAAKVEAIDRQSEKVLSVIERLVEYRSSVITNAVTGKIDVRGFPIPHTAEGTAL